MPSLIKFKFYAQTLALQVPLASIGLVTSPPPQVRPLQVPSMASYQVPLALVLPRSESTPTSRSESLRNYIFPIFANVSMASNRT